MGVNSAELNLDLNSDFVPKTISDFLSDLSAIHDVSKKLKKLNDYVGLLEDEIRKIQVFERELPLSMLLLNDAIKKLKEETMHFMEMRIGPVMEEFIPLKGKSNEDGGVKRSIDNSDKKKWMSSVQLWSNNIAQYENCDDIKNQDYLSAMDSRYGDISKKRGGGLVLPIKGESGLIMEEKEFIPKRGVSVSIPVVKMGPIDLNLDANGSCRRTSLGLSLMAEGNINSKAQQTQRKQRRCWSPELHRRFVNALQQLGGAQVATPKQIRELMQVEDLTNDEIKSHLQKYRLHVRKVPTSSSPSNLLWLGGNHYGGEVSKGNTDQSSSPEGPLHLTGSSANKGISISIEDSEERVSNP